MSAVTPYTANVRFLTNGEPVEASVTNRPIDDVAQRTEHLKQLLYAAVAGQSVVYHDLPCDLSVTPGDVVYIDTDSIIKLALVAVGANGLIANSAIVAGVVISKSNSQLCDVCCSGRVAAINTATWATKFETGVFTAGPVYLSQSTAGKITPYNGAVSVFVGNLSSAGELFVAPRPPYQDQHTHYEFNLAGTPAGTVVDPAVGTAHSITSPNPALAGWLPANSTYFPTAVIPLGAKFGYNLLHSSASGLLAVFPPLLLTTAVILADGTEINSIVTINASGIWWMTDAYGYAPWPTDYVAGGVPAKYVIRFIKSTSGSSAGYVANLRPDPSSVVPLEILDDLTGLVGSVGRLRLRIPGLGLTAGTTTPSGVAVADIAGTQFRTVPVANRLIAGTGISLSSTNSDATGAFGDITLSVVSTSSYVEAKLSTLGSAVASTYSGADTVALTAGVNASPIWQLSRNSLGNVVIRLDIIASDDASLTIPFSWAWKPLTTSNGWTTASGNAVRVSSSALAASYVSGGTVDIASGVGGSWTPGAYYTVDLSINLAALSPSEVEGLLLRITRNGASDGKAGALHILSVNYLPA